MESKVTMKQAADVNQQLHFLVKYEITNRSFKKEVYKSQTMQAIPDRGKRVKG
jgi:hypothetical protein